MKCGVTFDQREAVRAWVLRVREAVAALEAQEREEAGDDAAFAGVQNELARLRGAVNPRKDASSAARFAELQALVELHNCWAAGRDARLSALVDQFRVPVLELSTALEAIAHPHLESQVFVKDWLPGHEDVHYT